MRNEILDKKDLILELIDKKTSKREICRILNCKFSTLNLMLNKMSIIYTGNQGSKGVTSPLKKPVIYYLNDLKFITSHKLKNRLIQEGIKEHKCEICLNSEWMNKKIPIELHHIDGNNRNNYIDNLLIVCPNCHAQTDNYSGKNKVKKK